MGEGIWLRLKAAPTLSIEPGLAGLCVVFAISCLVSLSVFAALPAWAASWHNYSVAFETSSGGFTGLSAYRQDVPVGSQPNTGCSSPYSGVPLYQTQWVTNSDGLSWLELGTGHQCNDTHRYWYWGYGLNGNWYSLGYHTGISNNVAHSFKISRRFNGTMNIFVWQIDGNTKTTITSSATYGQDRAGLESYSAPPTYMNGYNISSPQAQRNGGSFVNWSGRDSTWVTNCAMCGKWISDTTWNAAESNPCPEVGAPAMKLSRPSLAASLLGVVVGLAASTIGIAHGLSSSAASPASSSPLGDAAGIDACNSTHATQSRTTAEPTRQPNGARTCSN